MKLIIFLISSFSILFSTSFCSDELQSQKFTPTSLSKPEALSWASTQLNSEPRTLTRKDLLWIEMYSLDRHPSVSKLSLDSLIGLRLKRDVDRATALSAMASRKKHDNTHTGINSTVYSGFTQGSGEYFTRIGFGSRSQLVQVIIDTGSDNIWIQCKPCISCYKQTDPIFDPKTSRTSSIVLCGDRRCPTTPCSQNTTCPYEVLYNDGSHTAGDYMIDTLTYRGSNVSNILFGCGHDNTGYFSGAGGLLGLGRGNKSFMGQAGNRFSQRFSYCLVGLNNPGKSYILFGPRAMSRKAVYTQMIKNPHQGLGTFYYVALKGISVGGVQVRFPEGIFNQDEMGGGGVIIDTGTTVTRLPIPAYIALRDAFERDYKSEANSGVPLLDTCYNFSGLTSVDVPTVVLHFKGKGKGKGADMNLPANNYMFPVDPTQMTFCFAFAGMKGGLSIIGNIQQAGFRVSYDLKKNQVGFTPLSCG